MELKYYPDPILRKKCSKVVTFDNSLRKLVSGMINIMIDTKGLGISAPQVGVSKRVIVVLVGEGQAMPMINPEIVFTSEDELEDEEGCLSFPGMFLKIKRSARATVKFKDVAGKEHQISPTDPYICRAIIHECQHLNGVLFIDLEEI